MTPQQPQPNPRFSMGMQLWVAIALALLLLITWLMGYGPGGSKCAANPPTAASAVGSLPASPAPAPVSAPLSAAVSSPVSAPIAPSAPASAVASASVKPQPATSAPAPAVTPAASAVVEPEPERALGKPTELAAASPVPVARIYFSSDKATVPKGATRSLSNVVKHLKANAGAKVFVSGFHEPSGNLVSNQKLALSRAQAVAATLVKMGIRKERIVLQKPAQMVGAEKSQAARRVEVTVIGS